LKFVVGALAPKTVKSHYFANSDSFKRFHNSLNNTDKPEMRIKILKHQTQTPLRTNPLLYTILVDMTLLSSPDKP